MRDFFSLTLAVLSLCACFSNYLDIRSNTVDIALLECNKNWQSGRERYFNSAIDEINGRLKQNDKDITDLFSNINALDDRTLRVIDYLKKNP